MDQEQQHEGMDKPAALFPSTDLTIEPEGEAISESVSTVP
jgi:hypothetical protein